MLKFHCTPITPKHVFNEYMVNRNVIISYLRPENYKQAIKVCDKIYFDNGAYTFFRQKKNPNWDKFYKFLVGKHFDKFFIPDVIGGTDQENNRLIDLVPQNFIDKGIPVFHIHESNERLKYLIDNFPYIALGSSGIYWKLGTDKWHYRINQLMSIICTKGKPKRKIHMLRCLQPEIFTLYPFYSGDSSNLAQNHKIRGAKEILENLEKYNSPDSYKFRKLYYQESIYDYL